MNLLNDLVSDFKKDFGSFLDGWGITPAELAPHYDRLVGKALKHLKKNEILSDYEKEAVRWNTKKTGRRDQMIYKIHNIFKDYGIKKTATDINHHITDILIFCGVEKGLHDTVFSKIDRAWHRLPKA